MSGFRLGFRHLDELGSFDGVCILIHTVQITRTEAFSKWIANLGDMQAVARIVARIRRMELGNPGDVKSIGDGVGAMQIDYGPGYGVYFKKRGKTVVMLLCGGDKKTQKRDIETAKRMAKAA